MKTLRRMTLALAASTALAGCGAGGGGYGSDSAYEAPPPPPPPEDGYLAAVSADGRFAAFASRSPSLVPGDTNGAMDVFVRELATGALERVSVTSRGGE